MLHKKTVKRAAVALILCLNFSLIGAYAAPVADDDNVLAQYELVISESGDVSLREISPRDLGLVLYYCDKVGTNTYKISIEVNGGSWFKIGKGQLIVDYGDGTIGSFTHGDTKELTAMFTTNALKYYTPGTYTLEVTDGYINTYDVLGQLEVLTDSDLLRFFSPEIITVS